MKTLITSVFVFFFSAKSFGLGYQNVDKASKFIKSDKMCTLAIGAIGSSKDLIISPVYCIWSGIHDAGTIHEGKGCMVGSLDLETGEYGPIKEAAVGVNSKETQGKECNKELVDNILHSIPFDHFHPGFGKDAFEAWLKKKRRNEVRVLFDEYSLWSGAPVSLKALPKDEPEYICEPVPGKKDTKTCRPRSK